jgi:hypothetical protein
MITEKLFKLSSGEVVAKELEPKRAYTKKYNPEPLQNRTRTVFAFCVLATWSGTLFVMLFHVGDANYDRYKEAFSAVSVIFSGLIGFYFGKRES